jgi:ubiquinone/menaquinone biosynthesis C-methylase UbiE
VTRSDFEERDRIRRYYRQRRNRLWRGADYVVSERQSMLLRAAGTAGIALNQARILDVGCGSGADLAFWRAQGVPEDSLFGTEIQPERTALAADNVPGATIVNVEGFTLPFRDGMFQLTSASMVLSSIVADVPRRTLFAEMMRVTASGGLIAVYDFRVRKPWNRSVIAITRQRAAALGRPPDDAWFAAPFLPALPVALALPRVMRGAALRVLPRTHVLYLWRH